METAITAGAFTILGLIVGYLYKWMSGETRAGISNLNAESIEKILNSAEKAVTMSTEALKESEKARVDDKVEMETLRTEIAQLRKRVSELEAVAEKVAFLESENIMLRNELKRRSNTRPIK
jgi:cell shape-determining protein MreC